MISTFWNLCRACPAVDVNKLHSEYSSTYKWHEFTANVQQEVIKHPPMSSNDFQFMRKKKHPDLAYKSHEFFDTSLSSGYPLRTSDVVDSGKHSMDDRRRQAQRRAQSEGPGIRNPLFRDDGNDIGPTPPKVVNHQRAEVAAVHGKREKSTPNKNEKVTISSSIQPVSESKDSKIANKSRQIQMKESLSMGQILVQPAMSEIEGTSNVLKVMSNSLSSTVNETAFNGKEQAIGKRREYSSEYRKSFRPFSQYEYIDGRFIHSHGFKSAAMAVANSNKAASLHGEPWYQEVVELRRQAQDYKCRGWGTDAVSSQGCVSHNQKQIELYEQAARRESLSALSLAITTSRPVFREDKIIERVSPTKIHRLARPLTAPPPRGTSSKSSRSESAHPVSDATVRPPSCPRGSHDQVDVPRGHATRQAPGRARSPTKRISRPPSASTASSSIAPSPAPEQEVNGAGKSAGKIQQSKRQRPTTLNTASSSYPPKSEIPPAKQDASKDVKGTGRSMPRKPIESKSTDKDASRVSSAVPEAVATLSGLSCHTASTAGAGARRPFSRSSSKTGGGVGTGGSRDTSRPPSAFENSIDYFREPVVKSPPEPTRVKSPEGIIRSPDPINWTVPLDTAKTFSVTQSVRDGDSARNSPMSDHSSLFDSVSGTAINLGRGSYHHPQRISSLAKEAILQPGLIKDSTMTRPSICANDPSKPLATEAHPNPSIPEAAEEIATKVDDTPKVMMTSVYQPSSYGSSKLINGSNGEKFDSKQPEGSSLKCLEDPSFEFDTTPKSSQMKPSYRVLEDPMMTSIYEPSTVATSQPTRPMPSEVLEGARERFDKFWGGKSKETPGES